MALTLLDHVIEFRTKLLISFVAVAVGAAAAHIYNESITAFLLKPLGGETLFFLSPFDPVLFILKVDLLAGTVLALPVINWAIFTFVRPAFTRTTWLSLLLLYSLSLSCAASSIAYAYFVSVPAGLHFLMSLNVPGIENMLTATSYLRFLLASGIILALISQIPIVVLAGLRYGVFNAAALSSRRGHIYLAAVIVLSILTPTTDPLNLLFILVPAAILFEGSLLAGRLLAFRSGRRN